MIIARALRREHGATDCARTVRRGQRDAPRTLALGIAQFAVGQHGTRFDLTLAVTTLSAPPIVVLFLLFQRHFVEGVSLSSMKG